MTVYVAPPVPTRRDRRSRRGAGRLEAPAEWNRRHSAVERERLRLNSSWLFAAWVLVCAAAYFTAMAGDRVAALFERWFGG